MKLLMSILLGAVYATLSVAAAVAQDAVAGEVVFHKCKVCHQIGESAHNMVGPVLNGVVGRKAGIYPEYSYSDANKNSGLTWDEATLAVYLKNPRGLVHGTKMAFAGLKNEADIANIIAYLKEFGPDGKKIETPAPAPKAPGG